MKRYKSQFISWRRKKTAPKMNPSSYFSRAWAKSLTFFDNHPFVSIAIIILFFGLSSAFLMRVAFPQSRIRIKAIAIAKSEHIKMSDGTLTNLIRDEIIRYSNVSQDSSRFQIWLEEFKGSGDLAFTLKEMEESNLISLTKDYEHVGLEIGGFSFDRIKFEWERIRYHMIEISGDIIITETGIQMIARDNKGNNWQVGTQDKSFKGLQRLYQRICLNILLEHRPALVSSYYRNILEMDSAIYACKRAIDKYSDFSKRKLFALFNLGLFKEYSGELDSAIQFYDQAIELTNDLNQKQLIESRKGYALSDIGEELLAIDEFNKIKEGSGSEKLKKQAFLSLAEIDPGKFKDEAVEYISDQELDDDEILDAVRITSVDTLRRILVDKSNSIDTAKRKQLTASINKSDTLEDVDPIIDNDLWPFASIGRSSPNNISIDKRKYTVGLDTIGLVPNWVLYFQTKQRLVENKSIQRNGTYGTDWDAKGSWLSTNNDYRGSGYDRGHLAPRSSFFWIGEDSIDLFINNFVNITPQKPKLNRSLWVRLEQAVRAHIIENDSCFVLTGILGEKEKLGGRTRVPDAYYKIVLRVDKNRKVNALYCYLMPNEDLFSTDINEYAVSLSHLEGAANMIFVNQGLLSGNVSKSKKYTLE